MPSNKKSNKGKSLRTPPAIQVETVDSQVEYEKKDATTFAVLLTDVPFRQETTRTSYDVDWVLPGYGVANDTDSRAGLAGQGVLCDLKHTDYLFTNLSPCTLYLRIQRPMGFRDNPASLGMWEPLGSGNKELLVAIKPRGSHSFTCSNGSTSHMVPRQKMLKSQAAVHLLSFAVSREAFSDTGNPMSGHLANEDGFELTVVTHYRANDGAVGDSQNYYVESFDGDSRLDYINSGPVLPIKVQELSVPEANIIGAVTQISLAKNVMFCVRSETGAANSQFYGLDSNTIYMLPNVVHGDNHNVSNISVIAFNLSKDGKGRYADDDPDRWVVGQMKLDDEKKDLAFSILTAKGEATGDKNPWAIYPGEMYLQPVYNSSHISKLSTRGKPPKRCLAARVHPSREYGFLALRDASVASRALKTLITIVKVLKVGIEIAGAAGLIMVTLPSPRQKLEPGPKREDPGGFEVLELTS